MKKAAIFGASKGIGKALLIETLKNPSFDYVIGSCRSVDSLQDVKSLYKDKLKVIHLDASKPETFDNIKESFSKLNQLDLCINSIGTLTDEFTSPERQISEVNQNSLEWAFKVNVIPTLLIAKELSNLFRNTEQPVFAAISAKVGSISDNAMGGWYSYRISKAALNMAIKNTAIEFKRLNKNGLVIALHPGTTETDLSKRFIENASKKYIIHQPEDTAKNLLKVINSLQPKEDSGKLFSWDGKEIQP